MTNDFLFFHTEGQNVAGGGQEYDAANSVMKLHQLALHNHLADVYEKVCFKLGSGMLEGLKM